MFYVCRVTLDDSNCSPHVRRRRVLRTRLVQPVERTGIIASRRTVNAASYTILTSRASVMPDAVLTVDKRVFIWNL